MRQYEFIIFDADGTLLDYKKAERYAFEHLCEDIGIEYAPELTEAYHLENSRIWREFEQDKITIDRLKIERFERTFSQLSIKADAVTASKQYLHHLGDAGFCFDGVHKMLTALKRDRQLALLTNGIAATQHSRLNKAGIAHFFHPIVISEEAGYQKPDPRIFEHLFERALYQDKKGTLMVGDSLSSDIAGGAAFGIDTCWINFDDAETVDNPEIRPTYTVTSFEQLLELLE
jgi:putative hydrolase of the HAD superfamily